MRHTYIFSVNIEAVFLQSFQVTVKVTSLTGQSAESSDSFLNMSANEASEKLLFFCARISSTANTLCSNA